MGVTADHADADEFGHGTHLVARQRQVVGHNDKSSVVLVVMVVDVSQLVGIVL